jgi:hypothetical protein
MLVILLTCGQLWSNYWLSSSYSQSNKNSRRSSKCSGLMKLMIEPNFTWTLICLTSKTYKSGIKNLISLMNNIWPTWDRWTQSYRISLKVSMMSTSNLYQRKTLKHLLVKNLNYKCKPLHKCLTILACLHSIALWTLLNYRTQLITDKQCQTNLRVLNISSLSYNF